MAQHDHNPNPAPIYDSTGAAFNRRAALLCTVFSVVNYALVLQLDFIPDLPQLRNICYILFSIVTSLSIYLIALRRDYQTAANVNIVFLTFFYIPLSWLFMGGLNGSAPLMFFMAAAFNILINGRLLRNALLTLHIILLGVLGYIEIRQPALITNTVLSSNGTLGNTLNIFYIIIATLMLIVFFTDQNRLSVQVLTDSNTRLRRANTELQQATEFQRGLIANISHDLNTPITLIAGYTQALNDGLVPPQQTGKYLELIHSKTIVLSDLIEDLLHLTRLESGQEHLDITPVPVNDIVSGISGRYQLDVESGGLTLEVNPLPQELHGEAVRIDRVQFSKVLSNLIYNALKFTSQGKITVGCSRSDKDAVFCVSDTGPGIAPEILPFIFERFYKESNSRNSETKGSGLGLNIAKQIVEMHGGDIWVTSTLGQGSTFCFSVPLDEE